MQRIISCIRQAYPRKAMKTVKQHYKSWSPVKLTTPEVVCNIAIRGLLDIFLFRRNLGEKVEKCSVSDLFFYVVEVIKHQTAGLFLCKRVICQTQKVFCLQREVNWNGFASRFLAHTSPIHNIYPRERRRNWARE